MAGWMGGMHWREEGDGPGGTAADAQASSRIRAGAGTAAATIHPRCWACACSADIWPTARTICTHMELEELQQHGSRCISPAMHCETTETLRFHCESRIAWSRLPASADCDSAQADMSGSCLTCIGSLSTVVHFHRHHAVHSLGLAHRRLHWRPLPVPPPAAASDRSASASRRHG